MAELLTSAPTLETERLRLRGPIKSDLEEFTRFVTSSPRMVAQDEVVSEENAWFGYLTGIGHWHWHGFGFFTLTLRDQNHPLGRVGLLKHSNWPDVELACRHLIAISTATLLELLIEGVVTGFCDRAAYRAIADGKSTKLRTI